MALQHEVKYGLVSICMRRKGAAKKEESEEEGEKREKEREKERKGQLHAG